MQTSKTNNIKKIEIPIEKRKQIEKNKDGQSFFCPNRHGWQRLTGIGNKLTCGCDAIRRPTYYSVVKRMKLIIEQNREFLDAKVWFEDEKHTCKIPLKIGSLDYFVPLRYFIEIDNIEVSDHNQYEMFFEHLKKVCIGIKLT